MDQDGQREGGEEKECSWAELLPRDLSAACSVPREGLALPEGTNYPFFQIKKPSCN